ncbi:MAG: hypothetical protein ACOYNI_10990 [Acidimicrobiia bacterium]
MTNTTARERCHQFTEAHYGHVPLGRLRQFGFTERQIRQGVSDGDWIPVYDEVYRIAGAPPSYRGSLLAACWAGGLRAHASHLAAAHLWGMPGGAPVLEITAPRWRRARHDGVTCHESNKIDAIDVTERFNIPVSCVERTLVDLCSKVSDALAERALNHAIRHGDTSECQLVAAAARLRARGRRGMARYRRILGLDRPVTESDPELRVLQALRRQALPLPETQYEVRSNHAFVARVDFAYPEVKLALEYDSDEHHSTDTEHSANARRRNALRTAGWTVLEIRRHHLRRGGFDELAIEIRSILRRLRTG